MQREPVIKAAAIVTLIEALLIAGVTLGWLSIDDPQMVAIRNVLAAAAAILTPLIGALWARTQVTPLSDPRDNEGRALTPKPPPY